MHAILIHWNPAARQTRRDELAAHCTHVDAPSETGPDLVRRIVDAAPDVVVIDLTRAQSLGRDMALALRRRRALRDVPIVFVDGPPERVEAIRTVMPEATFTTWDRIGTALRTEQDRPAIAPVSAFAPFASRPLVAKLGIREGMRVGVIDAPEDFVGSLEGLPSGVGFVDAGLPCDLTLWFVATAAELEGSSAAIARQSTWSPIWIIHPKKRSRQGGDLTQAVVRAFARMLGMVDYKVSAIDATWTGMLVRRRKGNTVRPA